MGLCKCPKRKVTNLFCFEHRVNVCEHCLVANHAKCIVQSYLQWLQDSDYNPNCRLCNIPLATRETTRLVCYDLFHWACLNERAAQLPQNTAPAGYQCPSCSGPIFPPTNLAGPVASALREKLATVNWARAGLGLPLIDEVVNPEPEHLNTSDFSDWSNFHANGTPEQDELASASAAPAFYSQAPRPPASPSRSEQHTVIHMGSSDPLPHGEPGDHPGRRRVERELGTLGGGTSGVQRPTWRDPSSLKVQALPPPTSEVLCHAGRGKDLLPSPPLTLLQASLPESVDAGGSAPAASAPRKVYDTRDDDRTPGLHRDCDDDKYRRRPALGWLAQLLRSRAGSHKRPLTLLQRAGLLLLLGLLGFLALLVLMSRLGRAAADSDPNLDPLMNPHIRVGPS